MSSILRLYYTVLLYHSNDFTYYAARLGVWAESEFACGFVAASALVLPRFIQDTCKRTPWRQIGESYQRLVGKCKSGEKCILGQDRVEKPPRQLVSDVEFYDLVVRTQGAEMIVGEVDINHIKQKDVSVTDATDA